MARRQVHENLEKRHLPDAVKKLRVTRRSDETDRTPLQQLDCACVIAGNQALQERGRRKRTPQCNQAVTHPVNDTGLQQLLMLPLDSVPEFGCAYATPVTYDKGPRNVSEVQAG